MYQLKEKDCPGDIMTIMLKAFDRCSMKGCSMEPGKKNRQARSEGRKKKSKILFSTLPQIPT